MTDPVPGSAPLARDPLVRGLGALAAGAASGAALITLGALVWRSLERRAAPPSQELGFWLLAGAVLGGMSAAALTGWRLSRGLPDPWRRILATMLAVAGCLLLALPAAPADLLAGPAGLTAYVVVLLAGAGWSARQAHRAGSP